MAFFSIGDDLHHIRVATEASLVEQKATNALLTAQNALLTTIATDTATYKTVLTAIDADLKKLIEALSEPVAEKIQADFDPPKTRP